MITNDKIAGHSQNQYQKQLDIVGITHLFVKKFKKNITIVKIVAVRENSWNSGGGGGGDRGGN